MPIGRNKRHELTRKVKLRNIPYWKSGWSYAVRVTFVDDKAHQEAEEADWASQLSQDVRVASPPKGIRIHAVIAGVIADWLATAAMLMAYALVFLRETIEKYGGFDKVPEHAFAHEDPLAFGLIGILGTVLGGYVAGRIARGRQVLHGVVVAVTSLLLGFALQLALDGRVLLYGWDILFVVLMIPAGALGGYVAYCLRKAVRPPAPGVPTTPIS